MTTKKSFIKSIDWPIASFLVINPLAALVLTPIVIYYTEVAWPLILFTLVFAAATNLSITAGYHRLFSHRSYEATWIVRFLYLFIGSSALQGSALKWSADHRRHHQKEDTDQDPYSINKGFWYAHMGWLFEKDPCDQPPRAADLEKDPMIRFQHNHYVFCATVTGFLFPMLIGYFLGNAWAGLVIAGSLRIALTQQSTFFVNSLCHTFGRQTYSDQITARDSLFVAFLTHGEGYHNFHHKFQIDYRNGIRWYQWDPTKWTINFLAFLGLASKLKKISQAEILKARLQMEEIRLKSRGFSSEKVEQLKNRILTAQTSLKKLHDDYHTKKSLLEESSKTKLAEIKADMEVAQLEFQMALKQWRTYVRAAAAYNS